MTAYARMALALVVGTVTACVQLYGPGSKLPKSRAMGGYEPDEIQSMVDLPTGIRAAVHENLEQRLGTEFLEQLEFSGGEIVDFEELYRINPGARDYRWIVPKYRLFFSFRARDLGIKEYRAEVELDENGAVISDIDLPRIAENPSKGTFVPFRIARKAATDRRFHATKVQIEYMEKFDAIVWRFERWDGAAHRYLAVSAHTAEVLDEWFAVPIH
jgi:hypothetical protein